MSTISESERSTISYMRRRIRFRLEQMLNACIDIDEGDKIYAWFDLKNLSGKLNQIKSLPSCEKWEFILNPIIEEYSEKYSVIIRNGRILLSK